MTMDGGLWSIVTIAGPLLLAAVMLWAITHNRRSRAEKRRTEEATRMRREERQHEAEVEGEKNPD